MKKLILAGLSACLLGAAGGASAQSGGLLYECDITKRDARVDWVSPKYAFVVQEAGVSVIDQIILHFLEEPVVVRPRQRANGMQLRWTVAAEDSRKTVARMSYRAVLDTDKKTVSIRVTPVGFPQGWSGSGTCTTRKP